MNIEITAEVEYIISTLEKNGYEAYAVGGCIRDSIMGGNPKDWDICTSAHPNQTIKCFKKHTIIETGLKHGTVTLILEHKPFEITTYRIDGDYIDNRRPDSVEFVSDLKKDLSRRDFTVNAIAYNPRDGIVDYFNGIDDIKSKIIRCVGNADQRFQEDALRIMRALRFASALGFTIDKNTSEAIYNNKILLKNIAVERIAIELNKLITGENAGNIIFEYTSVMTEIIPEIEEILHSGNNDSRWKCTVSNTDNAPVNAVLRLTALLYGITGHKPPQDASDTARKILRRLKYDNATVSSVTKLILYRDSEIKPERIHIKRWLNKTGENTFRQLIKIREADIKYQEILILLDEIINKRLCFSLKDLAVRGDDLINAGLSKGTEIGEILNLLLDMVIDEKVDNNKQDLLETALKIINRA